MQIRSTYVKAMDYTKVRPTTNCSFEKPQLTQACTSAAIEGFYMLGPVGAVTNSISTAVGLKTQMKHGKVIGALTGAATGAALFTAASHLMGASGGVLPTAAMGALGGAFSTLRGNNVSRFRDAGALGLGLAAPFQGGAKAGVALSGLIATEIEDEGLRALAAAGLGSAAGLMAGMAGYSTLNPMMSAIAAGTSSAFASVAGPKIGQSLRNLAEDLSHKMTAKKSEEDEPAKEKSFVSRAVGVVPIAMVRQGAMAAIMGKANLVSWATGLTIDSSLAAYEIYLTKKREDCERAQAEQLAETQKASMTGIQSTVRQTEAA